LKVLLRSAKSKLYLQGTREWTSERSVARDFGSGAKAIQFAAQTRLGKLELVLAFDDPHYDITLPLGEL